MTAARLRDAVEKRVSALTTAEVAGYYAHHRRNFYVPDQRVVYLIEHLSSHASAVALGKRIGPGARFIKRRSVSSCAARLRLKGSVAETGNSST